MIRKLCKVVLVQLLVLVLLANPVFAQSDNGYSSQLSNQFVKETVKASGATSNSKVGLCSVLDTLLNLLGNILNISSEKNDTKEYMVRFKGNADKSIIVKYGGQVLSEYKNFPELLAVKMSEKSARELSKDPNIEYVSPVVIYTGD